MIKKPLQQRIKDNLFICIRLQIDRFSQTIGVAKTSVSTSPFVWANVLGTEKQKHGENNHEKYQNINLPCKYTQYPKAFA